MKDFLKTMLASALGCIMACVFMFMFISVIALVFAAGVAAFSSSGDSAAYVSVEDNTMMVVNVEGAINERNHPKDVFQSFLREDMPSNIGLFELEKSLKLAAKDDRIKGLYLRLHWVSAGWAKVTAMRKLLKTFKASGKPIYAYSEAYNEKLYYLASISDEIIMYPQGDFEWNGIYIKSMFFKKTLAKLDVEPILIRVGKYKSAGEMIIRENMSQANKEQVSALTSSLWKHIVETISADHEDLTVEKLNEIAKNLSVQSGQEAYNQNLVTHLMTIEDVEKRILKFTGVKDEEPRLAMWDSYLESEEEVPFLRTKKKVAIVVANGEILSGRGNDENRIYSDNLSLLIRKLSKDKKVKAVVLRINSPGGSALASDVIWNSLEHMKQKNKKLVSSFSDVAASGGYYIAAGSDYIFAEPTTVTGSIGVFGMIFNTTKFFDNKLGVTFDDVKTHGTADMMTGRALTNFEKKKIQSSVNTIYQTFMSVVQQGRAPLTTIEAVEDIAQGRVWSGTQALEKGLVDGMGSLDEAVLKAAELAGLEDYEVVLYPDQKRWVDKVFDSLGDVWMPSWFQSAVAWFKQETVAAGRSSHIYTRLPFLIDVN